MDVLELLLQDGALNLDKDTQTVEFVKGLYDGQGAFRNSHGKSDLLSTAYALRTLRILFALQVADLEPIGDYLLGCRQEDGGFSPTPGNDAPSNLQSTYYGVTSLNCLGKEYDFEPTQKFILGLLEGDGAFAEGKNSRKTKVYDSFYGVFGLGALAHEFQNIEREAVLSHISKQRNNDSGFRRSGHSKLSSLASTAAALLVKYHFDPKADLGELDIYVESLQSPDGGFLSFGGGINPDLVSTYHGLICHRIVGMPVAEANKDFINSLRAKNGGFSDLAAGSEPSLKDTYHAVAGLCLL